MCFGRRNEIMEIGIDLSNSEQRLQQGLQFDVQVLKARLAEILPGVSFEEEYHEQHIRRLKEAVALRGDGNNAINIAERDARERGPRYGFRFVLPNGGRIEGGISKYCLTFRFSPDVLIPVKETIEIFLKSFSISVYRIE